MSSTLDATSCCAAKEDERHLHQRKVDFRLAANSHSAAFNGQRSRHVERHQRNYFRANKVSLWLEKGQPFLTFIV